MFFIIANKTLILHKICHLQQFLIGFFVHIQYLKILKQ